MECIRVVLDIVFHKDHYPTRESCVTYGNVFLTLYFIQSCSMYYFLYMRFMFVNPKGSEFRNKPWVKFARLGCVVGIILTFLMFIPIWLDDWMGHHGNDDLEWGVRPHWQQMACYENGEEHYEITNLLNFKEAEAKCATDGYDWQELQASETRCRGYTRWYMLIISVVTDLWLSVLLLALFVAPLRDVVKGSGNDASSDMGKVMIRNAIWSSFTIICTLIGLSIVTFAGPHLSMNQAIWILKADDFSDYVTAVMVFSDAKLRFFPWRWCIFITGDQGREAHNIHEEEEEEDDSDEMGYTLNMVETTKPDVLRRTTVELVESHHHSHSSLLKAKSDKCSNSPKQPYIGRQDTVEMLRRNKKVIVPDTSSDTEDVGKPLGDAVRLSVGPLPPNTVRSRDTAGFAETDTMADSGKQDENPSPEPDATSMGAQSDGALSDGAQSETYELQTKKQSEAAEAPDEEVESATAELQNKESDNSTVDLNLPDGERDTQDRDVADDVHEPGSKDDAPDEDGGDAQQSDEAVPDAQQSDEAVAARDEAADADAEATSERDKAQTECDDQKPDAPTEI